MAQIPGDYDLEGVSLGKGEFDFSEVLSSAHQIEEELKAQGLSEDAATAPRAPHPGNPQKGKGVAPRGPQSPSRGVQSRGRGGKMGRGGVKGAGRGQSVMMEKFLGAGVTPGPSESVSPMPIETTTSQELEEITAVSEALSDTVSDLTTQLAGAVDRITRLEQSNLSLQQTLNRMAKEITTMRANKAGSVGPPVKVSQTPVGVKGTSKSGGAGERAKQTIIAPKPVPQAQETLATSTGGEWGVEEEIE